MGHPVVHVPLNALRVFEVAARRGSFSAASEELCVTQSAVSHQIRQFEEWLGGPVFAREGNRIRLLPHGEALAQTLAASFGEIDVACRRARRAAGPPTLVVAAIPSVATCWLIPRLANFRSRHPALEVRVVYAIHGQRMDYSDADFAVVFSAGVPRPAGLRVSPFLPGASAPVCNPRIAVGIADCDPGGGIEAAGLLHDSHLCGWREWMTRVGREVPACLPGPVFEDFNLLRAATLAGQGVALCPVALIEEDLVTGRLVRLSPVTVHEEFGYYLVERPSIDPIAQKAAAAFRSWLFAECGSR
jgi:LysR family transcriptional regulator, glycine cleavage system transcriptional activator